MYDMALDSGLTINEASWADSMIGAGIAFGAIIVGYISDVVHISRVRLLQLITICFSALFIAVAYVTSKILFYIVGFAFGFVVAGLPFYLLISFTKTWVLNFLIYCLYLLHCKNFVQRPV